MSTQQLCGIKAVFILSNGETTGITIRIGEQGVPVARAMLVSKGMWAFPHTEIVKRGGILDAESLRECEQTILDLCDQKWRHRYGTVDWQNASAHESRWKVTLRYDDDTVVRWRGVNAAPGNIDQLYNYLVDFGMPSIGLGFWGSYGRLVKGSFEDDLLAWLSGYAESIRIVVEANEHDDTKLAQIASELRDDMQLVSRWPLDATQLQNMLDAWGVDTSANGLCAADVTNASRAQMTCLFWALTCLPDMEDCLRQLVGQGILDLWCSRMAQIPVEERKEEKRQHDEDQQRMTQLIEGDIEHRMATKRPFTSYDVAQATGTTARMASVVIRRFVRRGALESIAHSAPRQYVLASCSSKTLSEGLPKAS